MRHLKTPSCALLLLLCAATGHAEAQPVAADPQTPADPQAPAGEPSAAPAPDPVGQKITPPDRASERPSSPAPAADLAAPAADLAAPAADLAAPAADLAAQAADPAAPMVEGEVIEIVDRVAPGSVQAVGAEELERFEYNDVHQVLGHVPGVYIRQEDGYGLRPNIGMRGASSERSAKIALMEDGVLIAPAPYSAPAAYYFPLITRMQRVEVFKGPAAVRYGPNTVGGAVNLVSRSIPREREIALDIAGGQHGFGKLHASLAESRDHLAVMVEAIKLRTDGFKELDGGGSTGFDKNDVQGKLRLDSDRARAIYHRLDVKLGYSDEVSNETYTGLSDEDFARNPYRRYAATRLDRMDWRHLRMQLDHRMDFAGTIQIDTTIYRNDFTRDWTKLNGFSGGDSLAEILANPTAAKNAVLYMVLTGQSDSATEGDGAMLRIGTNARDFVSQGFQTTARGEPRLFGTSHELVVGLRYHTDRAERFHYEQDYLMADQALVRADAAGDIIPILDATGSAKALSAYALDKVELGPVTVTAGLRGELVETRWSDRTTGVEVLDEGAYSVLIPGLGAVYQVTPSLGLLAGVHKGFVPVSPREVSQVAPEESVNYEAGLRYARGRASAELIGFFSDYSNLNAPCSQSISCDPGDSGMVFGGGAVHVLGLEALGSAELAPFGSLPSLRIPLLVSYTLTRSRFQNDFSSQNPTWGEVSAGDELPYVPAHQLAAQAGVRGARWDTALATRYVSAMRNQAGAGELVPGDHTDAMWVLDLAASYHFDRWGAAYLTIDNLLDDAHIVSRRPFGARPGKPRTVVVGYKNRF